jgi:phage-related minor tail protein
MSNRVYEIAFALGAQIQSSFNSTFANANNQIEDLGGGLSNAVGTAAKFGTAVTLAAGAAALALGGLAVNASEDLQKSLNGLQSQTGTVDNEMTDMRESMLAIYNNNFGESFDDIGKAMGTIASQSKLTGKELETTTQNALMLRDTFEMEVTESFRGADMLMKQFGITSDEAYGLIAQGAQQGLNKNENLLDSVNEYSAHFKQIGFDSEEMFNMFANGAKTGVFDIDKLGDAVKEFGIRSKDGSKGSMEAFTSLGLDADKMTKSFSAGGTEGKAAFDDIMESLSGMKDPLKQNTAGVALFGTMWEDMGAEAVLAMGNTKGEIETASDALERINAGKYNTFGEAMVGIKRNIETGVLIPIGDALLPALKSFSGWITTNMPQIKSGMLNAMTTVGDILKGAGDVITNYVIPPLESLWEWIQPNMPAIQSAMQTAFDAIKVGIDGVSTAFVSIIDWCVKYQEILTPLAAGITAGAIAFGIYSLAIGTWSVITGVATAVGTAFAAVIAFITSPIGIVVIAIGALIAVGVLLYKNWDTVKSVAMNVFGAIGSFVGDVAIGIADSFKVMVNGVIGGLNIIIETANKIPGINIPIIESLQTSGMVEASLKNNTRGVTQFATGGYVKHRPGGILANIGEGSEDEVVTPVSKLKNMLSSSSTTTSTSSAEQPIQVSYSPQIIIQGNADKAVLQEANQKGFDDFKTKYQSLQNRKQRLSFDRG